MTPVSEGSSWVSVEDPAGSNQFSRRCRVSDDYPRRDGRTATVVNRRADDVSVTAPTPQFTTRTGRFRRWKVAVKKLARYAGRPDSRGSALRVCGSAQPMTACLRDP